MSGDLSATIPALLVLAALVLWWHGWIQALERARVIAGNFCRKQHWQLLDQTVSLRGIRIARGERGLLLVRSWRFEFSTDGSQRLSGGLITAGVRPLRVWGDGPDGRVIEELVRQSR
ncbi:MAG: DUF3301 domain-containing protein [Wenzhouxiangellaceae bacterium]